MSVSNFGCLYSGTEVEHLQEYDPSPCLTICTVKKTIQEKVIKLDSEGNCEDDED